MPHTLWYRETTTGLVTIRLTDDRQPRDRRRLSDRDRSPTSLAAVSSILGSRPCPCMAVGEHEEEKKGKKKKKHRGTSLSKVGHVVTRSQVRTNKAMRSMETLRLTFVSLFFLFRLPLYFIFSSSFLFSLFTSAMSPCRNLVGWANRRSL